MNRNFQTALVFSLLLASGVCLAGSRVIATGGVSPIEGGAGGGLSPWAIIGGYSSSEEIGGSAYFTRARTGDLELQSGGITASWDNRLELSATRQQLSVRPQRQDIGVDVYGLKARVLGQLTYSALPQISVGLQHKRNRDVVAGATGEIADDHGTDVYLAASKFWFAAVANRDLLVNVTARRTSAVETGFLGFASSSELVFEGSAVLFLSRRWVAGVEYRQKPNLVSVVEEDDWGDLFVGYYPHKNLSIVLARVDMQDVGGLRDQRGWYLSLQGHL